MSIEEHESCLATEAGLTTAKRRRLTCGTIVALALIVVGIGSPNLIDNPGAGANGSGALRARPVQDELIIRYSRITREEAVGSGINEEYAGVAALAFQGLSISPEQTTIEPVYREVVEQMRTQGFNENLALLSLIEKHESSSARLASSAFFEKIQARNSPYGFARAFVVRFQTQQDVPAIIQAINRSRAFFRSKNLIVRASPVFASPVVGMQVDSLSGTLSTPIPACGEVGAKVAVIADQFIPRTDLPKLQSVSLVKSGASGCDTTPYQPESESYGTNIAGVISTICPSCTVLGFDAGCGMEGKSVVRTTEGAQGALSAILRGTSVLMFTTADARVDPVYEDLLFAASDAGVVVVAPAGDTAGSSFNYPAVSKGVIGVAALNQDGTPARFSTSGSWVVAAARGALIPSTHKESGYATLSSSALAAARFAGFAARYLQRNPEASLINITALASRGVLSEPVPDECSAQAEGDNGTGGSSSGRGANGGPSGGGNSTGGGDAQGGGSSSQDPSGNSSNSATPTAIPTRTPANTPAGSSGGDNGSSGGEARSLSLLGLPDSMRNKEAADDPFVVQKIRSALSTQQVKIGVASSKTEKQESFVVSSSINDARADIYFAKGSTVEQKLAWFQKVGAPVEVDQQSNEWMQTIHVPPGVDIQAEFKNQIGLFGLYLYKKSSQSQASQAENQSPKEALSSILPAAPGQAPEPIVKPLSSGSGVSMSSSSAPNAAALAEMGWNEDVRTFAQRLTTKVKVALISTGIDSNNSAFQGGITTDLRVTDASILSAGDFPQDEDGVGSQIASLLAHERFGIARNFVELIPIKISRTARELENNPPYIMQVIRGIAFAVNKGAEVIILPHGLNIDGCHPGLGHAMYKAWEKGVTFILMAGDGLRNQSGERIGFPVVPASDDGPASYETTSNPGCWGNYFLGAVSFAASEGFAKPLPRFSNYGPFIELSAMGVGLSTAGLNNSTVSATGSAYSAAWGAAAAAMAISHHKGLRMSYAPWYVEALTVNSARRDPNNAAVERSNRFGSLLNFTNLMNLLIRTESMTDDERRNNILAINPRQGTGWLPGQDMSDLRYVALTLTKASVAAGAEFGYKVVAFMRSGEQRDVTAQAEISLPTFQDTKLVELVSPGVLKMGAPELFASPIVPRNLSLTAYFLFGKAQGFDSATVQLELPEDGRESILDRIEIKRQGAGIGNNNGNTNSTASPVRVGQDINFFELFATYREKRRNDPEFHEVVKTVTGAGVWSTSEPNELKATLSPGIIDARFAVAGKEYKVFATFEGKSAEFLVRIEAEQVKRFYIHSFLGQNVRVQKGQIAVFDARTIFTLAGVDRERAIDAVWSQGTTVLQGGRATRSLRVDTSQLVPGTYTYTAKCIFRSVAGNVEHTASATITVVDIVKYIEMHIKHPILQVDRPFFVDLRAYQHNNSYSVVTEDAVWTTDRPASVTINRQGIGYARPGTEPGTITITAEYKGLKVSKKVNLILGSIVTGSNSLIDFLTIEIRPVWGPDRYCRLPDVSLWATYKDGSKRSVSLASVSFAQRNPNGTWGNVQFPIFGGTTLRASGTYNDGSTASGGGGNSIITTEFLIPTERVGRLVFTTTPDKPRAIYLNAVPVGDSMAQHQVCSLTEVSVEPPTGLGVRIRGGGVSYSAERLGTYKVSAKGFYTGMGVRELKEGYFTVQVDEVKPHRVVLETRWHGSESDRLQVYGEKTFAAALYDDKNRPLVYKRSELVLTVKEGDRVLSGRSEGSRSWVEQTGAAADRAVESRIKLFTFAKSLNQRYEFSAVHTPTGLKATYSFTDVGSWEASHTAPLDLPSEVPPERNTTVHPTCVEYAKKPTGLEFAGGKGLESDPLIICNKEQLLSYGQHYSFENTRYCRAAPSTCRADSSSGVSKRPIFTLLGDSIDFKGEKVLPIQFTWHNSSGLIFDAGMRSISNYVVVDSEQEFMALFRVGHALTFKNLIVENPTVRGSQFVAAIAAGGSVTASNVSVIGGVVWGKSWIGGAFTDAVDLENVRVFGTEVRYELGAVGGVARNVAGKSNKLLFTGTIAPAGVPVNLGTTGGIAAEMVGVVTNVLMTGSVLTLNAFDSQGRDASGVGGIVGTNRSLLINAVLRGNVVSTGGGVGGIAGIQPGLAMAPDPLKPFDPKIRANRDIAIIRARVEGNIWGGMDRKQLECIDKVAKILGIGGSTQCIGDIKSQRGGRSDVGGIVGVNLGGLIQESVFAGTVRGVTGVGGIAGYDAQGGWILEQVSNYVRNESRGTVSASDSASGYGALIGLSEPYGGHLLSRFDSNIIVPGPENPTWAIGKQGKVINSTMTNNVPDYYDR